MFSGIVERLCKISSVKREKDFSTVEIDLEKFAEGIKIGDSIAVNGVCLTVAGMRKSRAKVEIMDETLKKTNLGILGKDDKVNIERPLKFGQRVGGHFVLGHVDFLGEIKKEIAGGKNKTLWISFPRRFRKFIGPKGCVSVDGISLTVVDVGKDEFSIALIPHTLKNTTLGFKGAGDKVNVELDYIAKVVFSLLER